MLLTSIKPSYANSSKMVGMVGGQLQWGSFMSDLIPGKYPII
jgi:hypothetical protein